jgi:hypothetical protein
MDKKRFFELIMDVCDWDKSGDDDAVLAPLITFLSGLSVDEIFSFDDIMSGLLFDLDTKKNYKRACKYYDHSDDTFLYSRCCALINGEEFYEKVKAGKNNNIWTMEFEAILSVPMLAWSKKYNKNCEEYPHLTEKSIETGSNSDSWK